MNDTSLEAIDYVSAEAVAEAESQAYKESARLPVSKIAGYVLTSVGQRISAVALGLSDARSIRVWQEGGDIRSDNEDRLRLLYRVAKTVATVYDEATARAFLRASSPYLADESPVRAIEDNREAAVLEAMRAFLEG